MVPPFFARAITYTRLNECFIPSGQHTLPHDYGRLPVPPFPADISLGCVFGMPCAPRFHHPRLSLPHKQTYFSQSDSDFKIFKTEAIITLFTSLVKSVACYHLLSYCFGSSFLSKSSFFLARIFSTKELSTSYTHSSLPLTLA